MKIAPIEYRRVSTANEVPLSDILKKNNTDKIDLALRIAAASGQVSDVECLLLDYDACPDNKSSNGFTALDWALSKEMLPKETLVLLYHMQTCDSAAKKLLENSLNFEKWRKNDLLALAIHRRNKSDETILTETFKADIHAAREIFMKTTYEYETGSFEDQYLKKYIEIATEVTAEINAKSISMGFRKAYCDFHAKEVFSAANSLGMDNILAGLQVAMTAAGAEEIQANQGIIQKMIEQRFSQQDPLMGEMMRFFKPKALENASNAMKKAQPLQEKIISNMLTNMATQLHEQAARSSPNPGV